MSTYKYAQGDDAASDAYVNSIAGNRAKPQQNYSKLETDGGQWYSSDAEPVYRNKCSRIIVITVSVILFLVGVGVMILGKVQQDKKVLPLCPHCTDLITACYIVGGALAFFALIGLAGALTRIRCFAFIYTFLLVLLGLVCCAAGFAVVAFDTNLKQSDVEKLWDDAVSANEDFICDIQDRLNCSGFNSCCLNIGDFCPNYTAAECLTRCTSNGNLEPCQQKVEAEVKDHFKPLMGVTFGLALVLFITAIASVRMTKKS